MKQKLLTYLSSFRFFKKSLPLLIDNAEKIVRTVYSRINLTKKNVLKANIFKPPIGSQDISVIRLDYTNVAFCKKKAKKHEKPKSDRSYYGFAILTAAEIRNCEFDVVYSPIKGENLFHADIKIGFIPEKGQQLPAQISYKIENLIKLARFYPDPYPKNRKWTGKKLV